MLSGKKILVIICGGIAAYKALELIRRLKSLNAQIFPVMTPAAKHFVTEMSVGVLAESKVYSELFDLQDESEIGHINLARSADLIIVVPATANFLAKVASGICSNLAETIVAAANCRVIMIPAMNVKMWERKTNQRAVETLKGDGVHFIGPACGEMACGDFGEGRFEDLDVIETSIKNFFGSKKLFGKRILITSGSTHEPIDPIRFISNRSSGKQGSSIASALSELGAEVIFISGPSTENSPEGVNLIKVETAEQMFEEALSQKNIDVAICVAAVGDWRVKRLSKNKIKKDLESELNLQLVKNKDILKTISQSKNRPRLVIGFSAETQKVVEHAKEKRANKMCDWILANDVSRSDSSMGGDFNVITLVTSQGVETWPKLSKYEVGIRLAERISNAI